MATDKKHVIDLQHRVFGDLEQATEYVDNRLESDRIVHLTLQPNYMPADDKDYIDSVYRNLHYKTCTPECDNDVSLAAWAVYLGMHPFLDKDSLRRQHRHDNRTWTTIVYDRKYVCSSVPGKVLGNKRASIGNYIGDTCTSIWTPVKNHASRNLKAGLEEGRAESVELAELLGKSSMPGVEGVKKLMSGKDSERFLELFEAHLSPAAKMAIDMSDTVGNIMLCPVGCNATRAGTWGDCDSIQYFLAHVYKYFETGNVRFLNRLFAGHYVAGRLVYEKHESLSDVPSEPNKCAEAYLAMLDRAGVADWEGLLDEFCFHSFCVEHDEELRPMDFRFGHPVEWDGEGHYDATSRSLEEDDKMFSNLADAIIRRNAEIHEKLKNN